MKAILIALAALLISSAASAALNLNTVSKDELVGLPGIGPSKAQAILDYRNQNGPFKSVDEIRKVKGIGEKLFQQIKPELVVGTVPRAAVTGAPAKAEAKADTKTPVRAQTGAIAKDAPKK